MTKFLYTGDCVSSLEGVSVKFSNGLLTDSRTSAYCQVGDYQPGPEWKPPAAIVFCWSLSVWNPILYVMVDLNTWEKWPTNLYTHLQHDQLVHPFCCILQGKKANYIHEILHIYIMNKARPLKLCSCSWLARLFKCVPCLHVLETNKSPPSHSLRISLKCHEFSNNQILCFIRTQI